MASNSEKEEPSEAAPLELYLTEDLLRYIAGEAK
jgi:hypothetical protein